MTTTQTASATVQVYQIFIKATPEAIWQAITNPDWTTKYGYQAPVEYDLRPGGAYRCTASEAMKTFGSPDLVVDGQVIESDPPRKLVQTWRFLWSPELIAEGFTRVTWEIEPAYPGVSKLTVTHDLESAPLTAQQTAGKGQGGGGWAMLISDLKTLLETGKAFM
jgi:uncharacterized protein YndB with AHSA1/START domain